MGGSSVAVVSKPKGQRSSVRLEVVKEVKEKVGMAWYEERVEEEGAEGEE
jgi:hypothetical protein